MMHFKSVLVTGGAGFVGSNLAVNLKKSFADVRVIAVDNLMRRGSELSLDRLRRHGVEFVHGDIRCPEDLRQLPDFDLLLECSAEPSVHAGLDGSPEALVKINLVGTLNCLEAARRQGAAVLFLSSSRVYPIGLLNSLTYREDETRFSLCNTQTVRGCRAEGVAEDFPLEGPRSFYGATKLASELLLQEYVFSYAMPGLIYRCGVVAGPWQMGRVDQGFVSLWVTRHHFRLPLKYIGFGGSGKQVRDVLDVRDLFDLVSIHLRDPSVWDGRSYNVGGGRRVSTSLLELTEICQRIIGNKLTITAEPATLPMDVRVYISDGSAVERDAHWSPRHTVEDIVLATARWVREQENLLSPVLG